jgi:predicted nuclease of predicted toxin-antitoxin system
MSIDAITTIEAGLRTMSDISQWDFAQSQHRVIVTSDDDFLSRAAVDTNHNGIVFFSKDSRSVGEVIDWLILIHGAMTPEELCGQVEFVPSRI